MNLEFQPLLINNLPPILKRLPMFGQVTICDNYYSYLDIDDQFIQQIYPLIPYQASIIKPDYFSAKTNCMGAHITITYPEEHTHIAQLEAGKTLLFEVEGTYTVILLKKKYYVLRIISPDLLSLRTKYGLPNKLRFKGHLIDFHITVAMENIAL